MCTVRGFSITNINNNNNAKKIERRISNECFNYDDYIISR